MLGRGGELSQKILRKYHIFSRKWKNVSAHIIFFPENDKKISGHNIILTENNKIFQDIPKYKNKYKHKSKAFGQKMQSERHFFTEVKGTCSRKIVLYCIELYLNTVYSSGFTKDITYIYIYLQKITWNNSNYKI
jgi:hypothetical protein